LMSYLAYDAFSPESMFSVQSGGSGVARGS
jgi:hypothetical protein